MGGQGWGVGGDLCSTLDNVFCPNEHELRFVSKFCHQVASDEASLVTKFEFLLRVMNKLLIDFS